MSNISNSEQIKSAVLSYAHMYLDSNGDVWENTWADDGNLYSVADDSMGFNCSAAYNFTFSRLAGNDPYMLTGTTVNNMSEYGIAGYCNEKDGCCWKAMGVTSADGVIYVAIARHDYGSNSGDPVKRQTSQNTCIIKSTDYGVTWHRSEQENLESPMFPGSRFGAPYFIKYGKNGYATVDNADKYVYAVSNNGFWDNGDNMVLGRVSRSKIGDLNGSDWEFYKGGDGMSDTSWSKNTDESVIIINNPGRCSMTGAQYIAPLNRYIMIQWYYSAGSGQNFETIGGLNLENPTQETMWDFYEAPAPWGPWTKFTSKKFCPMGYYNPCIIPKFISEDGKKIYIATNGSFMPQISEGLFVLYRLNIIECRLDNGEE